MIDSTLVNGTETVQRDQYEYRIVTRQLYGTVKVTKKSPPSIDETELNKYGRAGWELCGFINADFIVNRFEPFLDVQMVFKRLKAKARIQSN
ncbi:unnamed protein product [Adineta steineri]|uniref:DUF4177 domain-containing protein n=1 Tax=Adineta steineri TaxID=433720 RepID=A0A819GYR8_9BILA|nr:unnamed protein product [Adineta steineri]CAF1100494.1 unnamed protein product [Adineta steineri]CAF1175491.1 unnamed protein product [Adineta steineri]CAF3621189.1 unnamed protein product [Adineta steineri]CAF3893470.1 unnamed protein product [Adineta steineri]